MSIPFSNRSTSGTTIAGIVMMAAALLAALPARAMFSGEVAPEGSILPPDLPIFSTFIVAFVVAVIFFFVSHALSRR
jgi:hypothetical protein